MSKARLTDIAARTGLSQTTVGKVLNGGSSAIRVSEATRAKILEVARELCYQPNAMASGLRKGKAKLVGVLSDSFASRRLSMLLRELERQACARSYRLLTSLTHDDIDSMLSNCRAMLNYGAPGVICLTHDYIGMPEKVSAAFAGEERIVFLEPPRWGSGRFVATSLRQALIDGFAARKRLGATRFAVIHADPDWLSERILLGEYRAALAANGIGYAPEMEIQYPADDMPIEEACEYIIEKLILPYNPDVLFSDDAEHALYLQSHLLARGIVPPFILGGNDDIFFRYAAPAIPSLNPRYDLIASSLLGAVTEPDKFISGTLIHAQYPTGKDE